MSDFIIQRDKQNVNFTIRLTAHGKPWYVETFASREALLTFLTCYHVLTVPKERIRWLQQRNKGRLLVTDEVN